MQKNVKRAEASETPLLRYECPKEAAWGGFINVRMDDAASAAFHSWFEEHAAEVAYVLEEIMVAGIKQSMSWDKTNQCWICSFSGALVAESRSRYVVSSRASTPQEALALMVWKHCFMVRGEYGNYRPRTDSGFSWG